MTTFEIFALIFFIISLVLFFIGSNNEMNKNIDALMEKRKKQMDNKIINQSKSNDLEFTERKIRLHRIS